MLFVKGLYGNNSGSCSSVSKCTEMPFYGTGAKFGESRIKLKL